MTKIKIAFSGIGAVGGYYGGLMASYYKNSENVEVFFISRGENLKVIQKEGLHIHNNGKDILAIPTIATDKSAEIGPVDYLFCCTKSYDLEENIKQLMPIINTKTTIVSLLNGIDNVERIKKLLPDQTIWKGCVYIGARLIKPGLVEKFSEKERLFFGSSNDDKQKQNELLHLLLNAGINAFNPNDIDTRIWKKFLMISTAGTITSFYNLPIGKVIAEHSDKFLSLGTELRSIATATGIDLPEDIARTTIESQQMMPDNSTTSMHTDFIKGRKTELETLTGYVVRLADKVGISAPTYQYMYNKLKSEPYPNNET